MAFLLASAAPRPNRSSDACCNTATVRARYLFCKVAHRHKIAYITSVTCIHNGSVAYIKVQQQIKSPMARAAVKMLKYLRLTMLATLFYERKHGAMRKHGAALLLGSALNPRLSLKHRRAAVKTLLKKSCTTLAAFLPAQRWACHPGWRAQARE